VAKSFAAGLALALQLAPWAWGAYTLEEALGDLEGGTLEEQCEAAEYLGTMGDEAALEPLIVALGDENPELRQRAAMALGELGSSRAVPALIRVLNDRDRAVQWFAATSLAKLGEPATKALLAELRSDDRDAAVGAAVALGRMKEAKAVGPLVDLLAAHDLYVREQAIEALVAIGKPSVGPLVKALGSSDVAARRSAVVALGRLGDGEAAAALVKLLGDSDPVTRQSAMVALRNMGPAAYEPLEGALASGEPAAQKGACEIVGYIRDARAVKPVAALLQAEDESVRWTAAKTLGALDGKYAVESLIGACRDPSPRVREVAVLALGRIKHFDAVPTLTHVAEEDPDDAVRAAAAEALAAITGRK
jgi:HEAT repeat protein